MRNLDTVARSAHHAARAANVPAAKADLDRWMSREYAGTAVTAELANGARITATLGSVSNMGFQGQMAHLTEDVTGAHRLAPITKIWMA
jgi:hypothetical protein